MVWLLSGCFRVPELQGQGIWAQTTNLIENRLADILKSPRGHAVDVQFEEDILNRKEPYAFVAPTKPPVMVTDMRTHREFGMQSAAAHTSLLNDDAYRHLEKICRGIPANKPIVLTSGSPLLNWPPMTLLRDLELKKKGLSPYLISVPVGVIINRQNLKDVRRKYEVGDLWDDHPEGRARFIKWIHDTLKPSYCVIFSGDVHHGSIIKGKAIMRASNDTQELWSFDIVNITSSPMKNESSELRDPLLGVPKASIADKILPTSNSEKVDLSGEKLSMTLFSDAVVLSGPLTTDNHLHLSIPTF
jgi:hypothetical protein